MKRVILTSSSRRQQYIEELVTLYKTKDSQIDQLRFELLHTKSYRESLVKRRDKCFQALVDLNVDRRIMLGKVGENRDILT